MKNIGIQNFTSPKGQTFAVNCAGIVSVLPYDPSYVPSTQTGGTTGAKALLVTPHGYFLPVTENFDSASGLWAKGLEAIAGNA